MHNRLILAGLAATGGLLTTTFLQVAVAVADTADVVSATGADAFTIGNYTFDPFTSPGVEGYAPVDQLTNTPPLLQLGGGDALPVAPQSFEVFSPTTDADLGGITGDETVVNLLGFTNAEFVVASASDGSAPAAGLPAVGSVYDVFNFGNGYENVYTATPSIAGAEGTVTDTLVTPQGDINLDSLFGGINAADPLNPGDAFTGLDVSGISGAPDAFSIGGFTLDPLTDAASTSAVTGEGFTLLTPLIAAPPLLEIGGGALESPEDGGTGLAQQSFDVYSGSGSAATEIGNITTNEDVTNLLGLTNTQLIVSAVTPAGDTTTGLPAVGTVLDATNLGNGYENVYTATPDVTTDGATAPGTVTDTLVTPYGDINLNSLVSDFNVANPLNPGDAFTGLQAGDSAIGADAFTIDGTTFDPTLAAGGAEGFDPVFQLVGAPPLLNLGGALLFGFLPLAPQNFDVYDGTGANATEIANITTSENVSDILGLTNTSITVQDVTPIGDATTGLPTEGSVYDVLNLGGGIENVYTAIPGLDGGADTVTDTLVTPFGNLDLSDLFGSLDAVLPLNPGDAFTAGLDVATSAASEAATGAATAIDPLAFLGL
jgi:hypothetical protein